jgi:hypothetical protein
VKGRPARFTGKGGHDSGYSEPQLPFGGRSGESPEKDIVIALGLPGHCPHQEMVKPRNPFGAFAQEASHAFTLTPAGATHLPWLP